MSEVFERTAELAREPRMLPAATYNLAHTLLARAGDCLFVPIRSMQYLAVLDREEFIFVDSQQRRWIQIAWVDFQPGARSAIEDRVPYEAVYYCEEGAALMQRLQGEFHRALQLLDERARPHESAEILRFAPRGGDEPGG
jgi:hypothetical protein